MVTSEEKKTIRKFDYFMRNLENLTGDKWKNNPASLEGLKLGEANGLVCYINKYVNNFYARKEAVVSHETKSTSYKVFVERI